MRINAAMANIQNKIYFLRGSKVMLDSDLAELYGVESFNLNKAVRRNTERFPSDFMFQLTPNEYQSLRFQIGISNIGRGGRRYPPYAFTEQGVAMLSSVLRSRRAANVNIAIMRAFVRLREMLSLNQNLSKKLHLLEERLQKHDSRLKKHGAQIRIVFQAIRELMNTSKRIGFQPN